MLKRIVTIIVITALLLTFLSSKVTITASASASVEDPFDVEIAPHFSSVVYLIQEPAYSTPCDERGDFKISLGTPSLTVNNSKVVYSSATTSETRVLLSKTDVPEINETTRTYIQFAYAVQKVTGGFANVSLYDSSQAWINVSIHNSAFYYNYSDGSWPPGNGVLYSPAVANTYYTLGLDLTTTSVTFYLYNSAGTLLADLYTATNNLTNGDQDELRFSLKGVANKISVDYLYILSSPDAGTADSQAEVSVLKPDNTLTEGRVDCDPTTLTQDMGLTDLREDLFDLTDPDLHSKSSATLAEIVTAGALRPENQQRATGKLTAEGWTNLGHTVTDSLASYIAEVESCDEDLVFIVDYYVDYLPIKLSVDNAIVKKAMAELNTAIGPIIDGLSSTPSTSSTSLAHTSWSIQDEVDYKLSQLDDTQKDAVVDDEMLTLRRNFLIFPVSSQMTDPGPQYRKMAEDQWNRMLDYSEQTKADLAEGYNAWMNSTTEAYNQLSEDLMYFITCTQSQIASLTQTYSDSLEQVERQFNKFYAYADTQFQATNAIIGKLLLQNGELSNYTHQVNEYFAGELRRSNEIIMNLTSTITDALSPGDFWNGVVDNGKVADEPFSIMGMTGNNVKTYTVLIIVAIASILVIVAISMIARGRKGGRLRK